MSRQYSDVRHDTIRVFDKILIGFTNSDQTLINDAEITSSRLTLTSDLVVGSRTVITVSDIILAPIATDISVSGTVSASDFNGAFYSVDNIQVIGAQSSDIIFNGVLTSDVSIITPISTGIAAPAVSATDEVIRLSSDIAVLSNTVHVMSSDILLLSSTVDTLLTKLRVHGLMG